MLSSPDDFYKKNLEHNYAVSWALTYFLRKAGHMYKDRNYERVCDIILKEVIKTGDWKKAARAGLATININQLNKDFLNFWNSNSKRNTAANHRLFDRQGKKAK